MSYYYSQKYPVYANNVVPPGATMEQIGCLITAGAMLISYFNDSPLYPDHFLNWLHRHNGLEADGRLRWSAITDATGGKLRYSNKANARQDETTYGLREVLLGNGTLHWVLDHPITPNKVIDPYDGKVKDYNDFSYTRSVYYIGKK